MRSAFGLALKRTAPGTKRVCEPNPGTGGINVGYPETAAGAVEGTFSQDFLNVPNRCVGLKLTLK